MADNVEQVPISRAEFDSHRREVSKDIENLGHAIVKLTDNVSRIAANTGRPHWQLMGFAFGVFSFVIVLFSGGYTYMDGLLRTKESELSHERTHSLTEMIDNLKYRGERWDDKFDLLFTIKDNN